VSTIRGEEARHYFLRWLMHVNSSPDIGITIVHDSPVDVLWRTDPAQPWIGVQVKRAYYKTNAVFPVVNMTRWDDRRYKGNDADWLVAIDLETDRMWWIPWKRASKYTRLTLNEKWDQYMLYIEPKEAQQCKRLPDDKAGDWDATFKF